MTANLRLVLQRCRFCKAHTFEARLQGSRVILDWSPSQVGTVVVSPSPSGAPLGFRLLSPTPGGYLPHSCKGFDNFKAYLAKYSNPQILRRK